MPWLKISVEAAGASAETLAERMLACAALSVSFHKTAARSPVAGGLRRRQRQPSQGRDKGLDGSGMAGDEVIEPPPGAVPLWPQVTVTGLFPPSVDAQALNSALGAIGASRIAWLRDEDWAAPCPGDAPELRFGDRLAVVPRDAPPPCAHEATPIQGEGEAIRTLPHRAAGLPDATLRLDPGLAFGSGQHPTTRSCLAWLADARLAGCSVLDYGCGSGILGIAAALLGAVRIVAVDVEPQALSATQANAGFNGVALDAVTTPDALARQPAFDLVLANILANTLIEVAPMLSSCLTAGGQLVLAGLLETQIDAVAAAYASLAFEPPSIDGEWARLTGRRRD
ncbi:MAG: 50S ribosomal protein L11 methyltransferase [Gammaproteobacteria bacterium]|nr:50S ribosomal protein L11 methyltransferase [Gammaproteobacteria bacterium]